MTGHEEWKRFIKSGKIEDYMRYKKHEKEPNQPEDAIKLTAENKIQDKNAMG